MKSIVYMIVFLLAISFVSALSNPVTFGGKTYYKVTSLDPTEDTGDEVCTKAGMVCNGYSESSTAVCKLFNPSAAESSSVSGDSSGVYCNGAPQSGVCSVKQNTCHICPACSVTVQCNQAIGGLYREMYVECASPTAARQCKITIPTNAVDFLNQLTGINAQLKACPINLPKNSGLLLANGATLVNVFMNNGQTQGFTITLNNKQVVGISKGGTTCKNFITVSENDLNSILASSNIGGAAAYMVAQKKVKIKGCKFLTKLKIIILSPFINYFAKKQAPTLPPPPPPPNCGNVGEQCNNRACWSGICGAPKENINGQWGFWNYQCIDQSDWVARCQASGNSPSSWNCLTGPCR